LSIFSASFGRKKYCIAFRSATSTSIPRTSICPMKYFNTHEWNVECNVAMYSPIICLLRPRLPKSKFASDSAESSTNRQAVNNCTPRSGFLLKKLRAIRYCRFRSCSL
uniref:Secreted protein n=1 Tax=Haemonchus placei TaxID=6290 RepID=A0A0N4VYE9_HAEPC